MNKKKVCSICSAIGKEACLKMQEELFKGISKYCDDLFNSQIKSVEIADTQLKNDVLNELSIAQLKVMASLATSYSQHLGISLSEFVAFIIEEHKFLQQEKMYSGMQQLIDESFIHEAAKKGGQA